MQKKRPALGAAFSHARKVEAETGGGHKKQRAVAARYLKRKGMPAMAKAGGEGSRGGRVIGHTAQGHPIYQSGAAKTDYSHFGAMDHLDAARSHLEISHQAIKNGDVALSKQHRLLASAHSAKGKQVHAKEMKQMAKPKPAPKPVQARPRPKAVEQALLATRSGAKVHLAHDAAHASYQKFSHTDHLDAAGHHLEHAQRAVSENRFDDAKRHLAISQGHSEKAKGIKIKLPRSPKKRTKASLEREDLRNENKPTGRSDVAASQPRRLQNSMTAMTKSKGEGSRGGHIIGHSKTTGKAKYAPSTAQASVPGNAPSHEEASKVVKDYKNFGYISINEAARHYGKDPKTVKYKYINGVKERREAQRSADVLSHAIAKNRLEKDTIMYRGMAVPKNAKVGDVLSTHGFTSATTGKSVANHFARKARERFGGKNATHDSAIATIHAPKGTPALDFNKHAASQDGEIDKEKEHLFDHRVKFRIAEDHGVGRGGHRQLVLHPVHIDEDVSDGIAGKAHAGLAKGMPSTLGAYQSAIAQSSAPGHLSDDDKYAMSRYQALFDKNHAAIAQARAEAFARMLAAQARR